MATQSAGRVLIIPKGDYDSATMYDMLDLVLHNGSSWLCKKSCTGQEPGTASTYWQEFANISEITADVALVRGYANEAKVSKDNAKTSETNAATSATGAMSSALSSSASATAAKTSETNAKSSETAAKTSETNAGTSATNAGNYSTAAKSYAVGGTGTRTDEDTDNAKYYYEQTKTISKVEIATTTKAGIVKPDGTTITVDTDGTIHGADTVKVDDDTIVKDSDTNKISVSDTFANSKLGTTGDSKTCTSTFTSDDVADGSATAWTTVTPLATGATHSNIFTKVSKMFKNIRYLYKVLGSTDLTTTDKTVTGAINELNSGKGAFGLTASKYSATTAYTAGQYCIYNDVLYRCIVACTGQLPTDATYFTATSTQGELATLNSNLSTKVSYKPTKDIGTGEDLNNYTSTGSYCVPTSVISKTLLNKPTTEEYAFRLDVISQRSDDVVRLYQHLYYTDNSSSGYWFRIYLSTGWGAWRQVALNSDLSGKLLWSGSFSSGSITVPNLSEWNWFIMTNEEGVSMFGNATYGGCTYLGYGSITPAITAYRFAVSGNTLTINDTCKGCSDGTSIKAITKIYGFAKVHS